MFSVMEIHIACSIPYHTTYLEIYNYKQNFELLVNFPAFNLSIIILIQYNIAFGKFSNLHCNPRYVHSSNDTTSKKKMKNENCNLFIATRFNLHFSSMYFIIIIHAYVSCCCCFVSRLLVIIIISVNKSKRKCHRLMSAKTFQ